MSLLPWQKDLWSSLQQRHSQSGLPHALLLTGLKGIGKHQLALHLAQWLLCLSPQKEGGCQQCHSCHLFNANNHPDFMLCQPEDNSRQIRIDSVRRVNDFLTKTPQISRCQVVSLAPVEVMHTGAANALLKTLEEPAGESFLLLETERFGSVLPTIRSRCQRINLTPPTHEQALSWLQEKAATAQQALSSEQANLALRIAQQAPLQAWQWIEQKNEQQHQLWLEQLQGWTAGTLSLQQAVKSMSSLEIQFITHCFYNALSDLIKAKLAIAPTWQILQGRISESLNVATLDTTKLLALQQSVAETLGHLLSGLGNYNKQLLCESLLLQWRELTSHNT